MKVKLKSISCSSIEQYDSCLNINQLDDDCLLHIFNELPTYHLVHMNEVCKRWSTLRETACRQRRSLEILAGPPRCHYGIRSWDLPNLDLMVQFDAEENTTGWWTSYGWRHGDEFPLTMCDLDHTEAFNRLLQLLPNIDSLRIMLNSYNSDVFPELVRILKHYAPQLKLLKLYICPLRPRKKSMDFSPLIETLNQMTKLEHLTFDVFNYLNIRDVNEDRSLWKPDKYPFDLPIIRQLKYCSIFTLDSFEHVLHMIQSHIEPNNQLLKKIHLRNKHYALSDGKDIKRLLSFNQHIAERVTDLQLNEVSCIPKFEKSIGNLVSFYRNLTNIHLRFENLSLAKLTRSLQSAHNLSCIHLEATTVDETETIMPVESVRALHFQIFLDCHPDFKSIPIPDAFPNIEVYAFRNFSTSCRLCKSRTDYGRCIYKSLKSLRRCEQLKRIWCDINLCFEYGYRSWGKGKYLMPGPDDSSDYHPFEGRMYRIL
ncbi:hypothetical protein BLOT_013369 [Blomia tropicalis]|nr:hypothetical protein BLOT_013369 [Blomia tropicalis]